MNNLMKYAKKETVFILSTIFSGIVTVLYLFSKFVTPSTTSSNLNINDLNTITDMIGSMVSIIQVIFYLFMILTFITAVFSGIYFFKKNKQEYVMLGEFIASSLCTILLLLSASGVNAICKIARVAISGDYSSLMALDYTKMLSSLTSAASNLKYFMYLSIIIFIANIIILLIAKKVIKIAGFNFTFDENIKQTSEEDNATVNQINHEKIKETTKNNLNKIKQFFKTKNGKITIGGIIAVIIGFSAYQIYDNFFNYTNIDLTKDITVYFEGKDGNGYISDCKFDLDYNKSDQDLKTFVETVYPDYDSNAKLSNGDEVTITMNYSQETAKANHINVTNDTKTFTVKDLIESYKTAQDLPKKLVTTLENEAAEKIKDAYQDRYSSTYQTEFQSLFLAKVKDSNYLEDQVVAVYKIDETYISSFSQEQTVETTYVAAYVDSVNSDYLNDSKHYWYINHLYDDSYHYLSDPSGIENSLKQSFEDYTLEKIK